MTFDEWWKTVTVGVEEKDNITDILMLSLKKVAQKAWNVSRSCPTCNRDLRLSVCPECGHSYRPNNHTKGSEDSELSGLKNHLLQGNRPETY